MMNLASRPGTSSPRILQVPVFFVNLAAIFFDHDASWYDSRHSAEDDYTVHVFLRRSKVHLLQISSMTRIDSHLFASQIAPSSIYILHPSFMCTGCRRTSITPLRMQHREECSICWAVAPSHLAVLAPQLASPRLDCGRHPFKKRNDGGFLTVISGEMSHLALEWFSHFIHYHHFFLSFT